MRQLSVLADKKTMKYLLLFIFFPVISHGKISAEIWTNLSLSEKVELVISYKEAAAEIESKQFHLSKQSSFGLFVQKAWAETNLDCIYAGWPSQRSTGSCKSPASLPDAKYSNGNCAVGEIQCQPLLFGSNLCVNHASKKSKQSVFSNCDKKFASENRDVKSVIDEIIKNNRDKDLLSLFEFVDKICSSGAQSKTGMCRRLEKTVQKVRAAYEAKKASAPAAVADAKTIMTEAQKKLDALNGKPPQSAGAVDCKEPHQSSTATATHTHLPTIEIAKTQQPVANATSVPVAQPPAVVPLAVVAAPIAAISEVSVSAAPANLGTNPAFVRERARDCKARSSGVSITSECGSEKIFGGFIFDQTDKTPAIGKPSLGRLIELKAFDSARDGTSLCPS